MNCLLCFGITSMKEDTSAQLRGRVALHGGARVITLVTLRKCTLSFKKEIALQERHGSDVFLLGGTHVGSLSSLCFVARLGLEGGVGTAAGTPSRQDSMKALNDSSSRGCPSAGFPWPAAVMGSLNIDAGTFAAS